MVTKEKDLTLWQIATLPEEQMVILKAIELLKRYSPRCISSDEYSFPNPNNANYIFHIDLRVVPDAEGLILKKSRCRRFAKFDDELNAYWQELMKGVATAIDETEKSGEGELALLAADREFLASDDCINFAAGMRAAFDRTRAQIASGIYIEPEKPKAPPSIDDSFVAKVGDPLYTGNRIRAGKDEGDEKHRRS